MHEFALLERVFALNAEFGHEVIVPPGDDMAVLSLGNARSLLAACDSAIEGVHVPRGIDPFVLGRKAVLRNVSDVAAMMNARPLATLACVTLPAGIDDEKAWQLFCGLRHTAAVWGAPLVGGDIARMSASSASAPIIASVTILALPVSNDLRVVTRSNARAGDGIYVTGSIGGAWDAATGFGRHLDFTPRLEVAHELHARMGDSISAAIDVSDGLGRDLGHIAMRSEVRLDIDLELVPLTEGCRARDAIAHGEDYELAFTCSEEPPPSVKGVPITRIGRVRDGAPQVWAKDKGDVFEITRAGYEHASATRGAR